MATRFYTSTSASPVGPTNTPDSSWENTSQDGGRRDLVRTKTNQSIVSSASVGGNASNPNDVLIQQFISEPLVGDQTINGTFKGQMLARGASNNFRAQCVVRVLSNDGTTVRGTLVASNTSAESSVWSTSSAVNRKFPLAAVSPVTVSQVNAQHGDRISVEIGARVHNTTTTSTNNFVRMGTQTAGDLPEDESSTSTTLAPWFEFSQTLIFHNTGTGTPAGQAPTVAGVGAVTHAGSGAIAGQAPTLVGVGAQRITGTGALAGQAPTVAGSGTHADSAITGTGAITSAAPTVAGAGLETFSGSGAATGQAPTSSGAGLQSLVASGAIAGQAALVAGSALEEFSGSAAVVAQAPTIAGAGSSVEEFAGDAILEAPLGEVLSEAVLAFAGDSAADAPVAEATSMAALAFTSAGALSAPPGEAAGTSGLAFASSAALAAPLAEIGASAAQAFVADSDLEAPLGEVAGVGATGLVNGTGDLVAPLAAIGSAAVLAFPAVASVVAPASMLATATKLAFAGSAALTAPGPTSSSAGRLAFRATSALVAPLAELEAQAAWGYVLSGSLVAPLATLSAASFIDYHRGTVSVEHLLRDMVSVGHSTDAPALLGTSSASALLGTRSRDAVSVGHTLGRWRWTWARPVPYEVGDVVLLQTVVPFKDEEGTPVNPTVTIRYRKPDGSVGSLTPAAGASTGHFEAELPVDAWGTWQAEWRATGAVSKTVRQFFTVAKPRVPAP